MHIRTIYKGHIQRLFISLKSVLTSKLSHYVQVERLHVARLVKALFLDS